MKPLEPWRLPLEGTHLIEASAGTGKTYTIGTLVLRLVLEAGLTIDQILVVTFTRAATAELRDRIRRRLVSALAVQTAPDDRASPGATDAAGDAPDDEGSPGAAGGPHASDGVARYLAERRAAGHAASDTAALGAALRDFDTAPIFTIHGFCQRVLQEFAFESGTSFEATLVDDATALQREIVADYWAAQTYSAPPVLVAHLMRAANVTPATLDRLATALARARGLDLLPAPDDAYGTVGAVGTVGTVGAGRADDGGAAARGAAGGAVRPSFDTAWLDRALAEWHAARAAARAAFAAGRAEAEPLLATGAALGHGRYSRRNVPNWLNQIDAWLRSDVQPAASEIAATIARFAAASIAAEVKAGFAPPSHPLLDALDRLAVADAQLAAGLDATCDRIRLGLAPYLERETRLRRLRANAQSFDDLLHDLAAALEGDRGPQLVGRARARYGAALIDEFQDTDEVQYRIFRTLFGPGGGSERPASAVAPAAFLALIGDPKQAIYAFRGADVFAYLRAADDAGPDRRWTLSRNRRSDEGLVKALNAVWSETRVPQPFVHPDIRYHAIRAHHPDRLVSGGGSTEPAAPLTILRITPDDPGAETDADGLLRAAWAHRVIPRRVAADIAQLLSAPPQLRVTAHPQDRTGTDEGELRAIEPGDIAVLTRTNPQAAAVQRALVRLGIPSVRHGDASVFETDEAAELARVLAAVVEPGAARLVRGALATRLLGADAARLRALAGDEAAWEAAVERFRGWQERWQHAGFIQAFRRIVDEAGVADRLLALPDGERRLTNVQHLAELIHRAAHANGHGPRALLGWLARMRTDVAARAAEVGDSAQLRLERDAKAVQVVTVHRSKGLEYPVVYCPYLWYRSQRRTKTAVRFTDPTDRRPKLDIAAAAAQAHVDAAEVDAFAEDMRLAYVALTRAMHACRIIWGPVAGAERSGLGRLCHPGGGGDGVDDVGRAGSGGGSGERSRLEAAWSHAARRMADSADLEADLAALAAACGGALEVRLLAAGAAPPWRPQPLPAAPPVARRFVGQIPRGHRRTSYSALVRPSRGLPSDAEVTRDHDAEADGSDAWVAIDGSPPAASAVGAAPSPVVTLDAFPAGADPGTCLHAVFERIDFTNPLPWPDVAADACLRAGLDPASADVLPSALAEIVGTRLGDGPRSFSLADVPRSVRLNEMPFVLPVALGPGAGERRPFNPTDLAAALAVGGAEAVGGATTLPAGYTDAVANLGFEAVRGHLSGFVDLLFRVDGRWYIVDWKSNRLGSAWDDYAPHAIAGAMARHHYYLQYHLYAVAVHRYLGRRVPGYRYADHFGGAFYLFVRGMHPALGPSRGVFFDRPPEARIARLDAVLGGGAGW